MSKEIKDAPFKLILPDSKTTGGASVLMIGSTRCGKTTALKHILDTYFKKHIGAIFSESARAPAYKHMEYPGLPLSSCYIPELVKASYQINKETSNKYDFLYVLDDCPLVRNDKQLLKMLSIYRNSGISAIVAVQSPTLLSPTCRSNFNFVMLFKQNTAAQIESIIKNFLRGYFPAGMSMEARIEEYRKMTEENHFLLIDNLNGTISRTKIDLKV